MQTYLFYFIHIHTHTFKKLKENIVTQEISLKYEYTYNKIKRWMATYECKKLISRTPIETRDFIAFPRAQRRLIIRRTFVSTFATDTENTEDEIYSFKARRIIGLIVRQFGGA